MRTIVRRNINGVLLTPARRSFFPPPPSVLSPAPVAGDAKSFFNKNINNNNNINENTNVVKNKGEMKSRGLDSVREIKFSSISSFPTSSVALNSNTLSKETNMDVSQVNNDGNNNNNIGSSSHTTNSKEPPQNQEEPKVVDNNQNDNNNNNNNIISKSQHSPLSAFLSTEAIVKHVPKPAKFAASLVADALNISPLKNINNNNINNNNNNNNNSVNGELRQEYREHCVLGWAPQDLYRVVADVAQYNTFLPWCLDSVVHHIKRLDEDDNNNNNNNNIMRSSTSECALEMIATLTVGFSFFKEKYTSRVILIPDKKVQAFLSEGVEKQRRGHVLKDLNCVWEFKTVPGNLNAVEVCFLVSFAFKNPMHSKFIMSHIVTVMTRSFEKHCEKLYGPPSRERERLSMN